MTSESGDVVKGLNSQLDAKNIEVEEKNTRIKDLETSLSEEQDKIVALTSDLTICKQEGADLTNDNDALKLKLQECGNKASGMKKELDETLANATNQVA